MHCLDKFYSNVDYFHKLYSKFGSVKIHGGMRIADRNRSVEKFVQRI